MAPLHLFQGYGIEIEYMLVDADSLDVRPVCDRVLQAVAGQIESEVEMGKTAWSNELALHVLEFKTNGPAPALAPLVDLFQSDVGRANALAASLGARLLPTGMHPWMDPSRDLVLWPHEANPIYERFHRIFDCRGHGWANLQSVHINLPFCGDEEFGRLHAAIRLVLPILPALAASTPIADGMPTGVLDTRLHHYRGNCARVPSVTGHVVPERVFTRRDYEQDLLGGIHADMLDHDPEGILRHEWVNARGAIARFDRDAIEIRLLDVQECPRADLAVCAAVVAVVGALVDERWTPLRSQQAWSEHRLAAILTEVIARAEKAPIEDAAYLAELGFPGTRTTAGGLWRHLVDAVLPATEVTSEPWRPTLDHVLEHGTLARRILVALGPRPSPARLRAVYGDLADCLAQGRLFR